MAALDPEIAVFKLGTYTGYVADEMLMRRVAMMLITAFAGMELFLAAVGLYGLIAYVVSRRMSEFGGRAALGAQPRDLVRLVVGSGLRLVGIGTVVGVVCSALAVKLVASHSASGLSATT